MSICLIKMMGQSENFFGSFLVTVFLSLKYRNLILIIQKKNQSGKGGKMIIRWMKKDWER
jgi:hypothetical protein